MTRPGLFAIALLLATPVLAQTRPAQSAPPKPLTAKERADPRAEWLQRARSYTAAIEADRFFLPHREQLILPGRLAALWWKSDPIAARAWLDDAVAGVEFSPDQENDDDRQARLEAARTLVRIAAPIYTPASKRLLTLLDSELQKDKDKGRGSVAANSQLANTVMATVQTVSHTDPQQAFEMSRELIRLRDGNSIETTYDNLYDKNPALATQFLQEAIASARADYHWSMLFGLAETAWPTFSEGVAPVPEELRSSILSLVAQALLRPAQTEEDQRRVCAAAPTAARLLPNYPPEQAGAVRAAIDACRGKGLRGTDKAIEVELKQKWSQAPDQALQMAEVEPDTRTRAQMKEVAAGKLMNKDPLRAVEIMDSFTEEEKNSLPESGWSTSRQMYAMTAIRKLYKDHDPAPVQRILDHTSDSDRPALLLAMAATLFQEKDPGLATIYLSQARALMDKWDPGDNPGPFLLLVNLYAQHMPEEATHVMAEAMTGLARVKPREKNAQGLHHPQLGDLVAPASLSPAMLDIDPEYLGAAIAKLDKPADRTSLRLGLATQCLRRYEAPRQPAPPAKANVAAPIAPAKPN